MRADREVVFDDAGLIGRVGRRHQLGVVLQRTCEVGGIAGSRCDERAHDVGRGSLIQASTWGMQPSSRVERALLDGGHRGSLTRRWEVVLSMSPSPSGSQAVAKAALDTRHRHRLRDAEVALAEGSTESGAGVA